MLLRRTIHAVVAFSLVAVVGCTTVDPYTGEQKTSNATKGAGIGAITGAVIGAATSSKKDRKKGALTGAVVGGAIGGGVGHYMDQQEAALAQKLRGTGVRVQREGDSIRLIMPGNITFALERAEIRSEFYPVLESVAIVLKEFDKTVVEVSGYTDSTGSFEFNQNLSEQRAASVSAYLQTQQIMASRLRTKGYGPRYPIGSNETAQGRQQNRRVEIQLQPTPM